MLCSFLLQGFCLKCLGVVMKKATKKEFIQSCMQAMFAAVDHRKEVCSIYPSVCIVYLSLSL